MRFFSTMSAPLKDTFFYFAYGSNLLKKRIRINNPTAEFVGIGKLDGHQLDFIKYSDHWRGTSATIIPIDNSHIWGAVWRLHVKDMPALDWQEGVDTNWYFAKTVDIITPDGKKIQCRTYQQTINPPLRSPNEELPLERRPSSTYLDCIINGAIECNLPEDYVIELKKIPHNGQKASPKMIEKLKINMWSFRMNINNLTAEFVSIACLDNYRLDFIRYSKFWEGPTATVVPTANAHIWGVVWCMHTDNMDILNEQEGVERKTYYPKYVEVLTPYLGSFTCRIYVQKINPLPIGDKDEIPVERWPSWIYKEVIILGALEHQLPPYYIKILEKIKDNGGKGGFKIYTLLFQYAKGKPCPCCLRQKMEKPHSIDLKQKQNA